MNKKSKKFEIQKIYENLLAKTIDTGLVSQEITDSIDVIINNNEKQKGVFTVVLTGLIYKYLFPEQDVRLHQVKIEGGYSGRSFDTKNVTPFLKKNSFPAMAESGWLTRSLEQNHPYDYEFPGAISSKKLKKAFLCIYNNLTQKNVEMILASFFKRMTKKRDSSRIILAKPKNLTISSVHELIVSHIKQKYTNTTGASRLPCIAIYSVYKSLFESGIWKDYTLVPLESHTASDLSTGAIGDIQINNKDGNPVEGIEIKARNVLDSTVVDVYRKISSMQSVRKYYILTSEEILDEEKIRAAVDNVRLRHGCDVVVNGVTKTLLYFLRLVNLNRFIEIYVDILASDDAIKYEHRKAWNDICDKV